ncbi:MAG: hypothetical protein J6K31_12080 [Parabacteroides sp.]|nr:hypothetical protein [Parabacteroides sp.]
MLKSIDVYLGHYIFGGQRFDRILSFSTYNEDYPNLKLDPTTQLFDKESTQATRYFYAPTYNDGENGSIVHATYKIQVITH